MEQLNYTAYEQKTVVTPKERLLKLYKKFNSLSREICVG